jgi:hypothetical protein
MTESYFLSQAGTSATARSKNGEGKDAKQELSSGSVNWLGYQPLVLKKETPATNNNIYSNGKQEFREQSVSHSFQFSSLRLSEDELYISSFTLYLELPPCLPWFSYT